MRTLSEPLAQALRCGAATLCHCLLLTRADGQILGFTTHDCALEVLGTICEPTHGLLTSQSIFEEGLNITGLEIEGALSSATLTKSDLLSGLYDNATLELFLVNWQNPAQTHHLRTGTLGEVQILDESFSVEVRSLAHPLNIEKGRVYTRHCGACLGDAQCGLNLTPFKVQGQVTAVSQNTLTISGLNLPIGALTQGFVFSPQNQQLPILQDEWRGTARLLHLHQNVPTTWVGQTILVVQGCNKTAQMCSAVFANIENFRGFPYIPSDDFALTYANAQNGPYDGSSLFR